MAFGGRSQIKFSNETFDLACTTCARQNKTVKAVNYCIQCSGYCCQSCTDIHKIFPTLVGHNLTDVWSGYQASGQRSRVPEFPTERCTKHKEKVVDMYCENHDVVGCYVCIAIEHKSCPERLIHSVPDMIDTLYKLSDCKQTHSLLKEMMISMDAQSKSAVTQLHELNRRKQGTLNKVTTFHKALEAIIRKLAESSKNEVEAAYKTLEKDILQNKCTADNIRQYLQMSDEKLEQSEGNIAQHFVCTKITKEEIIGNEKIKKLRHKKNDEILFIPNKSLMWSINNFQTIGQVLKRSGEQKRDRYKVKGSKDINTGSCRLNGFCLTTDNQLLVTDVGNRNLKSIDVENMSVVDNCTLDADPLGVCCISKQEAAVACGNMNKVQMVSIPNKMTLTRQIKMSHPCRGIAFNGDNLYVTDRGCIYIYDMTGTRLKTISRDNSGNQLFQETSRIAFNDRGDRKFVGDGRQGIVCFDEMRNYIQTIQDSKLTGAIGVCVDNRGNILASGLDSHNVMQFSEGGKNLGEVVGMKHRLRNPVMVGFHEELNSVFVVTANWGKLKMYELE